MGQVAITIMDKTYRLVCDDGDEDRLAQLAEYVKAKVDHVRAEVGNAGDERLFLMAALLITDELLAKRTTGQHAEPLDVDNAVQELRAAAEQMNSERPARETAPSAASVKARKRDTA